MYKAGVVVAVCLIQSPEFRALVLRPVRGDSHVRPPPPAAETPDAASVVGQPQALPDVGELVDLGVNATRES